MIKASKLTKKYKDKLAVDNITFEIATGKVTGFLGPNGAGKSTTMRLMLGIDKGSGETTFDNKQLTEYSQPSKVIGVLLEAKAFHPTRSARNHLRILADAGGISSKRVDEALDIVGLTDVAKKGPGKFSLGMSQRLGIAAAILGEPKYLFLDEPGNGLDPEGIAWLREFIKDYADRGNGVFVSSHLLSEMSQMADNVVVIGKGKLIVETSITKLLANSGHSGVFVRVSNVAKLEQTLRAKNIKFLSDDSGLLLNGATTDHIGKVAFEAGLPVLELTQREASLEKAFLELTENAAEYHATQEGSKS